MIMMCGFWCECFDIPSVVYTSNPPCYKCTATGEFVRWGDECKLAKEVDAK